MHLVCKIVLEQIKYSYNYESKSSFFFFYFFCVSVYLSEETLTLKLAVNGVFNNHLFQCFWKG